MEFKDVWQVEWDDATESIEKCYALDWTDGLPVVPPTVERMHTLRGPQRCWIRSSTL